MNFGAEVILLQTTHNNKTAAEQQSPLPTVMDDDPLTLTGIQKHLLIPDLSLTIRREVTSTNTLLRQTAMGGAKEGTVLLAQKQTGGKGRMGRAFYSPADTGVYCSILLRPQSLDLCDAANVTTIAAVAACEAIEIAGAGSASIKWVNDVFVSGKKVCGILTEGAVDPATSQAEFLIVGVGINVYPPRDGFPPELSHIAGSVFPTIRPDGRNRLAAFFLNRFLHITKQKKRKSIRLVIVNAALFSANKFWSFAPAKRHRQKHWMSIKIAVFWWNIKTGKKNIWSQEKSAFALYLNESAREFFRLTSSHKKRTINLKKPSEDRQ